MSKLLGKKIFCPKYVARTTTAIARATITKNSGNGTEMPVLVHYMHVPAIAVKIFQNMWVMGYDGLSL